MTRPPRLLASFAVAAVLVAAAPLAACSTSSGPTPGPAPTPAAGPATGPATGAATGSASGSASGAATAAATVSAGGAYPAAEVCAYLTGQLPVLEAVGSPVGAHANLVGNLFGFFQANSIVPDSAALDEATTARCPEVRQKVLTVTGLTSLTQL